METFIGVGLVLLIFLGIPFFLMFLGARALFKPSIERNGNYLKFKEESEAETLEERTENHPTIVRDLTEEEKTQLKSDHFLAKIAFDYIWTLPITLIVDIVLFVIYIYIGNLNIYRPQDFQSFVVVPLMIIMPVQVFQTVLALKEFPIYLDLRSPVFRTKGKVVKETRDFVDKDRKPTTLYVVHVKELGSAFSENSKYKEVFDKLKDGDKVAIEYSPRTKRAWNFYKV